MAIAARLKWFLDSRGARYELIPHAHTSTSLAAARAAHVPGERVAKSVLLEDERGYVMAVLPASERVELGKLNAALRRARDDTQARAVIITSGCERASRSSSIDSRPRSSRRFARRTRTGTMRCPGASSPRPRTCSSRSSRVA